MTGFPPAFAQAHTSGIHFVLFLPNLEDGGEDESSVSPRHSDMNESPRHRHKKMARGFSKYTNLIFNSAPKLLKKIKR